MKKVEFWAIQIGWEIVRATNGMEITRPIYFPEYKKPRKFRTENEAQLAIEKLNLEGAAVLERHWVL